MRLLLSILLISYLDSASQLIVITADLEMISTYGSRPLIWGLPLLQGPAQGPLHTCDPFEV